ncbi:unnamed protein product [Tilletia caries]|uniref:Uncharacterized protein n=1 Tax=Tilletia caries TaxID=13290 RepID=A0ABN7IL47_9BASI|nr:unnamed protein product [Tilletia caries]
MANTTTSTIPTTSTSAPSSTTTSPVPAQPFQLETTSGHVPSPHQHYLPASFYHRLRHRSIPLRQTTTIHRRIRRQRTKVSQSTNNSPTSLKAPCPSARAGGTKTPTPIPSALRSFLRAQAEANRSTTVESGGPGSNSNSNDSSGNTTSMSARSFFTEFGARGHRSDGSYGTTTTIRSDTGSAAGSGPGLRGSGGLIFGKAGASGTMGPPPDAEAHGGCGYGCGRGRECGVENISPAS